MVAAAKILLTMSLAAGVAQAQPQTPEPASPAQQVDDAVPITTVAVPASVDIPDAQAKKEFIEGQIAYDEGDYEHAVEHFLLSFQLSGRPQILFNLAAAHERLGNYAEAAAALRRYLPDAPEAEATPLRLRIKRLDQRATARANEAVELSELRTAAAQQLVVRREPNKRLAFALGGASAGALLLAGSLFYFARDAHTQAANFCENGLCRGEAESHRRRETRFLWGAGLTSAVAAAGAGMAVWAWRRDEQRLLGVLVTPNEAYLSLSTTF